MAQVDWALDSGGFSELSLFGRWKTTPDEYVDAVQRYRERIGRLVWAAPQDWMCEPAMLARTTLSVAVHQHRTVDNFCELEQMWRGPARSPFVPVLQGWRRDDYVRCLELYAAAGVDVTRYPVVGLGSVCRRQATREIGAVVTTLRMASPGLPLHGFGVKTAGLRRYGRMLASADSMAWSYAARREANALPGCRHRRCANCLRYALRWRAAVLDGLDRPAQGDLFEG